MENKKYKICVLPSDRTGVSKFRSVDPHIYLQTMYPEEFWVDIVYDPPYYDDNFWKKYDGKIEEVSKKSYDLFLKQNNIQTGIKNYNESISLILNFKNQINE